MNVLNKRIGLVKPSETLAIKARATELKAQGKSIVDLSTGEPDIDTPEFVKDGAIEALKKGYTKYTAVNGIEPLREAIAAKLQNENGLKYDKSQVIICNGGKQVLHNFFEVTLEQGDEVVIPAPYWVSYPPMVELAGGVPVILNTRPENGFKIDPVELRSKLTSKTKVVVLNSPSNPTGVSYSAEEQRQIGAVLKDSKCLIVSDEVYEKVVFGGFEFVSFAKACPDLFDRTVTVNAFSKSFSMTGWRVGYGAGPKAIIEAMGRFQSQSTSNVCSIAQYAALAALKGPQDFLRPVCDNYRKRLDMALEELAQIKGVSVPCNPQGAFYLFVRFDGAKEGMKKHSISGSAAFSTFLLDQVGVAVVPGEAFGDDLAFRISVGSSDQNVMEGLQRLKKGFAALLA